MLGKGHRFTIQPYVGYMAPAFFGGGHVGNAHLKTPVVIHHIFALCGTPHHQLFGAATVLVHGGAGFKGVPVQVHKNAPQGIGAIVGVGNLLRTGYQIGRLIYIHLHGVFDALLPVGGLGRGGATAHQ